VASQLLNRPFGAAVLGPRPKKSLPRALKDLAS
jgi:hypothetical protein